jgi:cytochrome b pre-mRNA-processing protein 3
LNIYKIDTNKKYLQELFDFVIKQIELSIREIGYGDVSVNKKMKEYVNLFYSIIEQIDLWNSSDNKYKTELMKNYLYIEKNLNYHVDYFEKYRSFLKKNALNNFTKDIINFKF